MSDKLKLKLIVLFQHMFDTVMELLLPNYYGDDRVAALDDHYKYLDGQMSDEEKASFEEMWAIDSTASEAVRTMVVKDSMLRIATGIFSEVYRTAVDHYLFRASTEEWACASRATDQIKEHEDTMSNI